MFRWAKIFSRVGVILERKLWLDAYAQSFVSPFASKAGRHGTYVKLSASTISRIHGNACASGVNVRRQSAHDASRDAKLSVHFAGRQDVHVQFCNGDAKSHSVDGDAKVLEFAPCMPLAKMRLNNGDVRKAESVESPNDDISVASSSNLNEKILPSDVSNASYETQSLHVSLQTLFQQTQQETQKAPSDLQQKIELLESEQFSLSDAATLLKTRAFKSCSVEHLTTMLQALKQVFPCAIVVHDILVCSSNVLLQPAELVQQKLKILHDFQVDENVVSLLCGKGRVLSVRMESLQKRLMFYKDAGLTVEARNKMFSRGPSILSFSLEHRIQPVLNFLESAGLTKERIWKLAERCPELFYMSLDSNLIKKYEYFRQLGFSVDKFPKVFHCTRRLAIKNMEEHVQSLKDLGFADEDICFMIKRQPSILAHASNNIKLKVDFLIREHKRDMAEIVRSPCCLMYSLQNRIVPRLNVVKELGYAKVYSLSYILDATDSTFIERFGKL